MRLKENASVYKKQENKQTHTLMFCHVSVLICWVTHCQDKHIIKLWFLMPPSSRGSIKGVHILSLVIAIQQSRVYLLKMWKKMWKCTQVQIFGKEFNIIPTPTKRWLEYQSSSREGTNTNFLQNWWSATAHKGGADTCSLLPIYFIIVDIFVPWSWVNWHWRSAVLSENLTNLPASV